MFIALLFIVYKNWKDMLRFLDLRSSVARAGDAWNIWFEIIVITAHCAVC